MNSCNSFAYIANLIFEGNARKDSAVDAGVGSDLFSELCASAHFSLDLFYISYFQNPWPLKKNQKTKLDFADCADFYYLPQNSVI